MRVQYVRSLKIQHISKPMQLETALHRPIEIYHNEIRENPKVRRGLGNDESAQDFAEMLQIYHNFIKPHMGLMARLLQKRWGLIWEKTNFKDYSDIVMRVPDLDSF